MRSHVVQHASRDLRRHLLAPQRFARSVNTRSRMFPILRFRHHDVRERRSSATVDDVRARDTVFDQFIRHRARVGVDAEFRRQRARRAETRRRGESIGDVSTADDVERAGAIFTIRFGERIAVESGDEIDARAAETEDSAGR